MKLLLISTKTPVGDFHMIAERPEGKGSSRDVVRASGFGSSATLRKRLPTDLLPEKLEKAEVYHPYAKAISAYFAGDRRALHSITSRQGGGDFSRGIWKVMSKVKPGKTASYKELAMAVGNPAAVRAVGTACAQNLLCLIVPCHRIVKSDGSIGNYYYGTKVKRALLEFEITQGHRPKSLE